MERQQGFSLIEVLVSLVLMTTTALALLQQQWHSQQLFNQVSLQAGALLILDNAVELRLSGYTSALSEKGAYALQEKPLDSAVELDVQWRYGDSRLSSIANKHLKRTVLS